MQRVRFPAYVISTASSSLKMFSGNILWAATLFSEEKRAG